VPDCRHALVWTRMPFYHAWVATEGKITCRAWAE
jgi:hypothetical protein